MKGLFLFSLLFIFVLLTNSSLLAFDMMYPEQPLIYLANQNLHSFHDLLQVYLHPQMFHLSILFFRPSGHFLMYQLLQPFFDWHNTRAFLVVNFVFLALTGLVMIKLYALLFPRFKVGGYVAFAIYLMHPALMLSRLIVLHFEFAYVFFSFLSLYCFVQFCQRKVLPQRVTQAHSFYLFFLALMFFTIACTFKEPALMLGPVLASYFCIVLYQGQNIKTFFSDIFRVKEWRQVLLLIFIFSLSLALYLSLQWPLLQHPLRHSIKPAAILAASGHLVGTLIGIQGDFFAGPVWRNVIFPFPAQLILWGLLSTLVVVTMVLFFCRKCSEEILANEKEQEDLLFGYKKSLLFLYLAAFLFMLLPLAWAWGLPWHLSLTLVCFCLMMGFSVEYFLRSCIRSKKLAERCGLLVALVASLMTLYVNKVNVHYLDREQGYALRVGRNAVLFPPKLKEHLDAASVLVVEDSRLHDPYLLGAAFYPYSSLKLAGPNLDADEKQFAETTSATYLKQQPIYNGSLFRWAYLQPSLQEEVYPFQVEQLETVPTLILYHWLQNYNHIFCLGYDEQGNWHDRTAIFKKNLLLEKQRRQLILHDYELKPAVAFEGSISHTLDLAFADYAACQLDCDQNSACQGFTYLHSQAMNQSLTRCQFYDSFSENSQQFCASCLGFVKKKT